MIQRPLSDPTLQDPDLTINGEQLSVCSSFKYLGNMIKNDALLNVEIKTRIGQATAAFSKLFQRVKPGTAKNTFKNLIGRMPIQVLKNNYWEKMGRFY